MGKVVCFALCLLMLASVSSAEGGFLAKFSSIFRPIFPQVANREESFGESFQAAVVETRRRKDTSQDDPCNKGVQVGFYEFCTNLENGEYHDPWNPYCGYIVCKDGKGKRMCCKAGTWMSIPFEAYRIPQYYCRREVRRSSEEERSCPQPSTDSQLCKVAQKVEEMNMLDN